MKHLIIWLMVLVLSIPAELWRNAPESERERARVLAVSEHCLKEAKRTGWTKFKIWETIENGFWQLHIEPVKPEA